MAYNRQSSFSVDATKVANTDQTNFTIRLIGTFNDFKSVANGGYMQKLDGSDINFYSDSLFTTPIKFERVVHDTTTGTVYYAFLIPTLSHTVNPTIYFNFGDASGTDQSDKVNTWDASHARILHCADVLTGSSQAVVDSLGNGNFTSAGSWTSAQQVTGAFAGGTLGTALSFLNANGDYLTFTGSLFNSAYTYEFWSSITVASNASIAFGDNGSTQDANWFGGFFRQFTGAADELGTGVADSTNTWIHHTVTRNATTGKSYRNGSDLTTSGTNMSNRTFNQFGRSSTTATSDIKFTEIIIHSVARSADWIKTAYNNMSSPSTFCTMGTSSPLNQATAKSFGFII